MALHKKIEEIERIEAELKQNPRELSLYEQLAEHYFASGIFSDRAFQVYERSLDLRPDNEISQRAMSICFLLQSVNELLDINNTDELHDNITLNQYYQSIEEILDEVPESADLIKSLGDICLIQGQLEKAYDLYDTAFQIAPNRLSGFLRTGNYASHMTPLPSDLAEFLGQIMENLGRPFLAYKILKKSFLQKNHPVLGEILIRLMKDQLIPNNDKEKADLFRLDLCEVYLGCDKVSDSLSEFRELSKEHVLSRIELVKRMSRALIRSEDYRGAFDCLSRIPVDDEAKTLLNEIASALEKTGELDTAAYLLQFINRHDIVIQEAQRLEEIEIERTAHLEMGDFNFNNKRYDRAILSYMLSLEMGVPEELDILDKIDSALLQVDHVDENILVRLGKFCLDLEKHLRAIRYLRRVFEMQPENKEVIENLRKCYDMVLQKDPESPEMLIQSAEIHLTLNNDEKGIQELEQAASFPERSKEANTRLVLYYLKHDRLVDSLEMAKQITDRFELQDEIYELMEGLTDKGQLHRALEAAKMLAQCNPEYLDIRSRVSDLESQVNLMNRTHNSSIGGVADPEMIELIGEIAIGRYKYIEKIGSGGMGIVHKVFDAKEEKPVAMKILRDSLTSSKKAIERFFREARIAATLQHDNIVNILDYHLDQNQGKSYIAMEYVDGPSMRDILEDRLSETMELTSDYIARNLYYSAQLCNALHVTHQRGIIHRDIKPDNVMINRDNVVKVTDFGIVHIEEATFTPTGALIGTPRYMSPEQVQGHRVDGRSDIYAVGIILYEMIVGTPPFLSGDVAYQHVHIQPTPIVEIHPHFPVQIDDIIKRCLAKDPDERYPSVENLKQALEVILFDLYPNEFEYLSRTEPIEIDNPNIESSIDLD